jgi:hypothetical protein
MQDTNQTVSYESTVSDCTNAVRKDIDTVNKWQTAGKSVRAFFGTEAALLEVKAQFIADAILPAIPKHQKALEVELVRKGSKEYNALDDKGRALWETLNKAKKDARATCDTYFSRIVKYAFPTEKADEGKAENVPTDTKTKIIEAINDAIKAAQKDQAPTYDAPTLIASLQSALAIASK